MNHFRQTVRIEHAPRGISDEVPEPLRIRLLGGFRVSVGSRAIEEDEWRLNKVKSLIKLLALSPRHSLHREQVMEALWPDLSPTAAANNLRYSLHNARRTLEPVPTAFRCYLRLHDERLELHPVGPLWVDVEAFEDAVVEARRAHDPTFYEAAIGLYGGDLLPEDRYAAWAESPREKLRRTYLELLLALAELYKESGELGFAAEALRQVVASEPTQERAHEELMRLYSLSGQPLVALRQYELLRKILSRDLGTEPDAASQRLYEEILAGRFSSTKLTLVGQPRKETAGVTRRNVPSGARTRFVGRERELVEVKRALAMTRLLTLTGTCGSGKTRLALEVTKDLGETYPHGVWVVELASLSEETLVPQVVAATLGVKERRGRSRTATLVDALRQKKALLVLDNCEHLVEAVARLVDTLLDSCQCLRVLATSREALSISGELKWLVAPLSVPDPRHSPTVEDAVEIDSMQLFLERARHQRPAFVLTPQNVEAVTDICRQLEGIPLAIELAAARVGMLSAEQIAARLECSLKLLTTGNRTAALRQRTLRGALDWSYALLTESERKLFARLSVFVGGWTLEAAEAVGSGGGIGDDDVLDLLGKLVDKSLVVAEAGGEGGLRYRILEPVRQYAQERLQASGEAELTWRRHAAWFLELAEEAEPRLRGLQQGVWLERLGREHDNLRAALSWMLERGEVERGLRLCGALGEFWHARGHLSEGRRWLEAALAEGGTLSAPPQAKALVLAGYIAWEQGDYERSRAFSEEGLAMSRKLEDADIAAAALANLAWAALYANRPGRASELAEEAATLERASGDATGLARALLILGMSAAVGRDYGRAAVLYEETLALAREAEDNFATILSLALGAFVFLGLGEYGRARALSAEGLELARHLKTGHLTATHLDISAALASSQGQPLRAARLWGAAETLRENTGTIFSPVERHVYGPYIATARSQLDEAAWGAAWAEARTMTLDVAVEYALSEEKSTPTSASEASSPGGQFDKLTRREREVAMLVGRGLMPHQISAELAISKSTVDNHTHNILKKLTLRSSAQLAVWVRDHG